jgi:catechol 2,3-dioxygenase-like lactoylglutathione lyase family enzyme
MSLKYTRITPSLPVTSISAAIDFYTTHLGFRVAGRDRDDHTWLQLVEGDSIGKYDAPVNVYLRRRGFPDVENDNGPGKVYIRVEGEEDELEKLFEKLKGSEVGVRAEISTKPWGLRDFTVSDIDGVSIFIPVFVLDFPDQHRI